MTISGTIEAIEHRPVHNENLITIMPDHRQKAFVKFRGLLQDESSKYKEGDSIKVEVLLEGKVSKNSGVHYNNLVATKIVKQ